MATDYISTETGCQYLRKYKIEDCAGILYDKGFNDGIETAISCIGNEVPAADVRPVVRGRWECATPVTCKCSECGHAIGDWYVARYNYCPSCGADMRKVVEIDQVKEGADA